MSVAERYECLINKLVAQVWTEIAKYPTNTPTQTIAPNVAGLVHLVAHRAGPTQPGVSLSEWADICTETYCQVIERLVHGVTM